MRRLNRGGSFAADVLGRSAGWNDVLLGPAPRDAGTQGRGNAETRRRGVRRWMAKRGSVRGPLSSAGEALSGECGRDGGGGGGDADGSGKSNRRLGEEKRRKEHTGGCLLPDAFHYESAQIFHAGFSCDFESHHDFFQSTLKIPSVQCSMSQFLHCASLCLSTHVAKRPRLLSWHHDVAGIWIVGVWIVGVWIVGHSHDLPSGQQESEHRASQQGHERHQIAPNSPPRQVTWPVEPRLPCLAGCACGKREAGVSRGADG